VPDTYPSANLQANLIPKIFLILSIGTVDGSDAALYAFSSISQQINLRSDRGIFSTE
jgi:hypothetical protein